MEKRTNNKLTRDEMRNGWDEAKLKKYLAEREHQTSLRIFGSPSDKKELRELKVENVRSSFNPHHWPKEGV